MIKQSSSEPIRTPSFLTQKTTDGFLRTKKPSAQSRSVSDGAQSSYAPDDTPVSAPAEEAPVSTRNPSVKNPGRVMDFVPHRSGAIMNHSAHDSNITVNRQAKHRSSSVQQVVKKTVVRPSGTTRVVRQTSATIQSIPDFDDAGNLDDLDYLLNLDDDTPVDEDEMASALAGFAETESRRDEQYTADEYDDDEYSSLSLTPSRRRDNRSSAQSFEYDDLDDIASDFSEEPKPFDPDGYKKTVHRTPFLTSVVVEKRPLSGSAPQAAQHASSETAPHQTRNANIDTPRATSGDAPRRSYNIPAPVDRPLSGVSKKPYTAPYESAYARSERGERGAQGKSTFTMSTPDVETKSWPVALAVLISVILGAIVGVVAYLLFFK